MRPEAAPEAPVSGRFFPLFSGARSGARPGKTVFPVACGRGSRIACLNFLLPSAGPEGNATWLTSLCPFLHKLKIIEEPEMIHCISFKELLKNCLVPEA